MSNGGRRGNYDDLSQARDLLGVGLKQEATINFAKGQVCQAAPYPVTMLEMIAARGLVEYTKRTLRER